LGLKDALLLRVAKRWISGADLDSAIKDAARANKRGMRVVINYLGEEVTQPVVADAHLRQYLSLQDAISMNKVEGCASVKLTQFGLGSDASAAESRFESVAENAERLGQLLWVDMEGSKFTDATLQVYSRAVSKHPKVGVALQAYLKRSESDLNNLLDEGGRVRLVKGAYRESPEIALHGRESVRENYRKLMTLLFERGENFAIATHDSQMVDAAKKLADGKHTVFEFEMLKGIRNELKEELVSTGYRVVEYLPYGEEWYAYSQRRMSEHPSNLVLLIRSLF